jgi:polyketide synthase 12/myxalamid-type polyketide synthase MxaB
MPYSRSEEDHVAIIGMSCRFPAGANSPEEFWRLLVEGRNAIGDIPASRWDRQAYYDPDGSAPGKMNTTRGGFLDTPVDRFDPAFFSISPKEAADMDPQQRILLELTWEALEDAGIVPASLRGGGTGVFVGVSTTDYSDISVRCNIDHATSYSLTGSCYSALAGRISFIFGLQGPSLAIDTACSSSLVAIDSACAALRLGRTGLALAGGFNLMLIPDMQICLTKLQALSPEGLCRSFDAAASGYARSEGGAIVVLKRLPEALADGDRILGVIRGSFVNQDGESTGISAPNGASQVQVIRAALADAGAVPGDIAYIEAHGTGTRVGDRTELTAIGEVMAPARGQDDPVLVGSVKSNIGHLEAASGVAGLIKVVLALRHGLIPGDLHFHTPNPNVDWARYPIRVVAANTPWPRGERPRLAGVSSFGFVGTNAHLILEEPPLAGPQATEEPAAEGPGVLPLSARGPEDLRRLVRRYAEFLKAGAGGATLADICRTAAVGRCHFEQRAAVAAGDLGGLLDGLTDLLEQESFARVGRGPARVAFLYTGQGAQSVGMGRQLMRAQPVFRRAMEECDAIYRATEDAEGASLLELLYGDDADAEKVNNTRYAQPLLFSVGYALTELWRSFGVTPAAVAGHSVGEYTAACAAGVFTLQDALRLVALRGRLMGSAPGEGLMAAVFAPREAVEPLLAAQAGGVSLAALNAPDNTVISGFAGPMREVLAELDARGLRYQQLRVSHAFHSPQMDPVLEAFRRAVSAVRLSEPGIPLISNATAAAAGPGLLTDPEYWVRHLRGPVRMAESLRFLQAEGCAALLELGPRPTLLSFARSCLDAPLPRLAASMKFRVPDQLALAEAAGELYQAGASLDWGRFAAPGRKVALPTYPFGGQRCWVAGGAGEGAAAAGRPGPAVSGGHPLLGQRIESPAMPETVLFQMDILRGRHHFFAEHVILGVETAPAAALLSWVWLAGREIFPGEAFALEDVTLAQPLILHDADRLGQILVREISSRRCAFEFLSREAGAGDAAEPWTTHCTGVIARGEPLAPADTPDLEALEARCTFHASGAEFYAAMTGMGYVYGPRFMGIEAAAADGADMLCRWRVAGRDDGTRDYWITPGELDVVFQSPAVALLQDASNSPGPGLIHVPFYVRRIALFRRPEAGLLRIHAHSAAAARENAGSVESSMRVVDGQGGLVAAVDGFVSSAVPLQALLREERQKPLRRMAYVEDWRPRALPPAAADDRPRVWALFAEPGPEAEALAGLLAPHGRVFRLEPGAEFAEIGDGRFRIDWERPGAFAEALARLGLGRGERAAVIHMLPGAFPVLGQAAAADIAAGAGARLRSLLLLTQAVLAADFPGRLYCVSAGGRSVRDEDFTARPRSCGAEGFLAVAGLELPERRVTHIDLSPEPDGTELAALAAELLADGPETRVCLRRGERLVARLVRWRPGRDGGLALPQGPYTLEMGGRGLDDLRLIPKARRAPGPGEVEFAIVASGLNFKDVLHSLGELRDSANRSGGESAGVVTRVGPGVDDLRPGDAVISRDMAGGAFSSYQTSPRRFLARKPDFLSFPEAASVPITFMTAWYGLLELADLKRGERVLIHAAAGGVGLAAVQIALDVGAEVFATAGSPRKRALLASLGVPHVFDSRSLDFAAEIPARTGGKGLDVVLNSLTGEALRRSLGLLGPNGRFIELGKRELLPPDMVRAQHPTAVYYSFDLTDVLMVSPDARADMFAALMDKFATGALKPVPVQAFPVRQAPRAFRFMAQALHVGRVALTHDAPMRERELTDGTPLRLDGTYLITGGLGALGLELAGWLAAHPVGTIVLAGRRPPSGAALERIEALRRDGAEVIAAQCDVSDAADCARLMARIDALPHPLRGVIHAAGVLDDRSIAQMDWDRFAAVLQPKTQGAWNLHLATRCRLLDFFVLFSSASCTLGNRGQANYAAGNAFMNALALHRRAQGLCAASVCWGPFAEVGMAAGGSQAGARMAKSGILGIRPADGVAALAGIIGKDLAVPTIVNMDWRAFLETLPGDLAATLFEDLAASGPAAAPAADRREDEDSGAASALVRIKAAPADERPALVLELVRRLAGRIMGYTDMSLVPTDLSITRMGLDSLMTMDFRNQVEKRLGVQLPYAFLAEHASLEDIAARIVRELPR